MRLMLELESAGDFAYQEVNPYFIHSLIWNTLKETEFSAMHDQPKFKFFTFSNIWPVGDFKEGEKKNLIISSPILQLIEALFENFPETFKLGTHEFELVGKKKIQMQLKTRWQTATPIVLYEDNQSNTYYSVKRNPDLGFFLERLKDNALKKYNAFYNEDLKLEEPLFDRFFFKKQVAIHLRKNQKEFLILGTHWNFDLSIYKLNKYRRLYEFLTDCGLGEKNSLGFGFVNMIKEKQKNSGKALITCER